MSERWRIGDDVDNPGIGDVIIQHGEDSRKTRQIEQRKREQQQQDSQNENKQEQDQEQ